MPSTNGRAPYAEAGEVGRRAIDRLLELDPPPSAMRVAFAVFRHLTTWSRVEDALPRTQLARMTRLDDKYLRAGLRWCVDAGILTWTPGGGRKVSRVALVAHDPLSLVTGGQPQEGVTNNGGEGVADDRGTPGRQRTRPPVAGDPPSEKCPEEIPESSSERAVVDEATTILAQRITAEQEPGVVKHAPSYAARVARDERPVVATLAAQYPDLSAGQLADRAHADLAKGDTMPKQPLTDEERADLAAALAHNYETADVAEDDVRYMIGGHPELKDHPELVEAGVECWRRLAEAPSAEGERVRATWDPLRFGSPALTSRTKARRPPGFRAGFFRGVGSRG